MYFEIDKNTNLQVILSRTKIFLDRLDTTMSKKNEIQMVISELMYNIHKYAPKGNIEITVAQNTLKIVASDVGSGIKDIHKAFIDGYSSGNTLGLGLPAIIRLSDDFHAQTSDNGTIISIVKIL